MSAKLQNLLGMARRARGATLREVERATGISNAYLSQLETGAVNEPSPKKLEALANYFGIPYEALMKACGYPVSGQSSGEEGYDGSHFMGQRLTHEESAALAAFLHHLRNSKKRSR